jgi:hypothetical protein
MKFAMAKNSTARDLDSPWAMHMDAVALDDPRCLALSLRSVIVNGGGWVLSRGVSDTGIITLLFEFERHACVDIYSGLVGAGLEFTRDGHLRFTELCQCTHSNRDGCGTEIASVELEIQTYPVETAKPQAAPLA